MRTVGDRLDIIDTMARDAARNGIIHLTADPVALDGRTVSISGSSMLSFGSCSYLGLETDDRLKQGVIDAVERYGTQFSSSRSYLSAPLYEELEGLLGQLFEAPVLATSCTTHAHLAAIPILVGERDAIVMDQQVHHSVQTAIHSARSQGTRVEVIGHSNLDALEAQIKDLRRTCSKVWFMGDGIYSMFGDPAPLEGLADLLDRYDCLHLYLDDAHGMSWTGRNGRGYVLERLRHPRLVVTVSLNKGFAAAGGALVFPDPELRRRVMTLGGTIIFSGPIQPPMLGAAVASARLHLSGEIAALQDRLLDRIRYCNELLKRYELPLVADSEMPIRYVEAGLPRAAFATVKRLMDEGIYTNFATFPAVPAKRSGVRFMVNAKHERADLELLAEKLANHLRPPAVGPAMIGGNVELTVTPGLRLEHATSISWLDEREWDGMLGDRGSFSWEGLRFLEGTFRGHERPENNWQFHYFTVRDAAGKTVLATFFTEALWKDDMLAPGSVSEAVEARRAQDPYYLTTPAIAMGSLLTEGDHLYLDRSADWRGAMRLLLAAVAQEQGRAGAGLTVLRDLAADPELDDFLLEMGYARFPVAESLVLDLDWDTEDAWYERLSHYARKHQRHKVRPWNDAYEVEVLAGDGRRPSAQEFAHYYRLYEAVKARNLSLNTWSLPQTLFGRMFEYPGWELMVLSPRGGGPAAGVLGAFHAGDVYAPMVIGLDYRFVESQGLYRQFLRQMMHRGKALGAKRVLLGVGATFEKTRFGATVLPRYAYFQAEDHDNAAVLDQIWADAVRAGGR